MVDKKSTQTPQVQRIRRTVNDLLDLVNTATFTVDLDDFGDWLTALDWEDFYVSRHETGPGLFVFRNGMYQGHYVALHARGATAVEGYEVPDRDDADRHLTLPASEVDKVRAEVTVA
jgi:hypothetical protein